MAEMALKFKANGLRECMFVAHLVILAQIDDELSCGRAEFSKILSQNGQNNIECHA